MVKKGGNKGKHSGANNANNLTKTNQTKPKSHGGERSNAGASTLIERAKQKNPNQHSVFGFMAVLERRREEENERHEDEGEEENRDAEGDDGEGVHVAREPAPVGAGVEQPAAGLPAGGAGGDDDLMEIDVDNDGAGAPIPAHDWIHAAGLDGDDDDFDPRSVDAEELESENGLDSGEDDSGDESGSEDEGEAGGRGREGKKRKKGFEYTGGSADFIKKCVKTVTNSRYTNANGEHRYKHLEEGKLWFHPDDPTITLKNAGADKYSVPSVFIWSPKSIGGHIRCPDCDSDRCELNKWTSGRRIVDVDRCYALVGGRYKCRDCEARSKSEKLAGRDGNVC